MEDKSATNLSQHQEIRWRGIAPVGIGNIKETPCTKLTRKGLTDLLFSGELSESDAKFAKELLKEDTFLESKFGSRKG